MLLSELSPFALHFMMTEYPIIENRLSPTDLLTADNDVINDFFYYWKCDIIK